MRCIKMVRTERYRVAHVIDALRKTKGMKGPAAKLLGCTWNTVDAYAKRHPSVQQAIDEERELMTDVAELALIRKINEGEAWAVCFYLKTQGKKRGYVERAELTGPGGGPIESRAVLDERTITLLDELATYKRNGSSQQELSSENGSS